jgi:hypothetical protein
MASVIQSPADIVNAALAQIGHKNRVGSLYEGSRAAKNALDVYGQTRDQLLREGDWPFAQRDIIGVLIKSAPAGGYVPPNVWDPSSNPPQPWLYEYAYGTDFIKVRAVKPQLILIPNFSPQPHLFTVANDSNVRVVLSNVQNAVITYVGQITDPTQMPPDFVEAFISAMGRRLAPLLANMDAAKMEAQAEQVETTLAERQQG